MKRPSPPLNAADAVNHPTLDVFVPEGGDREGTARLLTQTADENDLSPQHIRVGVNGGFWISEDLADIVYDGAEDNESESEPDANQTSRKGE